MYCPQCGKAIGDAAKFCRYCGCSAEESVDALPETDPNRERPANPHLHGWTMEAIGSALAYVGFVCGALVAIFMITEGEIIGYSAWDYAVRGGREISILVAVFSGVLFLTGIYMRFGIVKSNKK